MRWSGLETTGVAVEEGEEVEERDLTRTMRLP